MNKQLVLGLLLMALVCFTLIGVSSVQAFDFDNVKSYDSDKKEIRIRDSFLGIPTTDLAYITLVNYTEECTINECYLTYRVDNKKDDSKIFRGSSVWNGKQSVLYPRTNKYEYWDNNYNWNDVITDWSCDYEDLISHQNGSYTPNCSYKEKEYNYKGKWVDYDLNKPLPKGVHYIRENVDVRQWEKVDTIPNFYSLDIEEWITLLSNDYTTDAQGNALPSGSAHATSNGFRIISKYNQNITNVTLDTGSTATRALLLNAAKGIIKTAPVTNFVANLNTNMTANTTYYVVADADGSVANYDYSVGPPSGNYPIDKTNIIYDKGKNRLNPDDNGLYVFLSIQTLRSSSTLLLPNLTIDTPANLTITSNNLLDINYTANQIGGISSCWYSNDTYLVNTTLAGCANITNVVWSEGGHNLTIWVNDTEDDINRTSITFTIDTTLPEVNITSPANESVYISYTDHHAVVINYTIIDTNLDSCWYFNGSQNVSLTCGVNISADFGAGWNTIKLFANDSSGNEANDKVSFLINVVNYSVTYTSSVIETATTDILINFTASGITTLAANLTWNGVVYEMTTLNNATAGGSNYTLTLPEISSDTTFNFTIDYNIDGTAASTGNYEQRVYNIPDPVISADCAPASINFSILDEVNLTTIGNNTIDYNFAYGTSGNNTHNRIFGKLTNVKEFHVCINTTLGDFEIGEGQIFYTSPNYVDRRYYLFEGTSLTNVTSNITLYNLLDSEQTSFKLEVEDNSLNPYVEKYTTLVRWYPDLNEYNVVDMGQTDETGSTIIHVKVEDVDYRIGVYEKNGSLIRLADPMRMVCLVTPCTYTLTISPTEIDYTSFLNIDYTFTYNTTTSMWSFIWSDASQLTSDMNLTIYKVTGTNVYPVCSNSVSGFTGAVTCNTSAYSGTLRGEVERYASPPIPIISKIISTGSTAFSSQWGLFLSLLIALPIIFIFAFVSPVAAIVGGVISLLPALYFGTITIAIIGGFAILGGIVLHFLKRVG